jgi:hypothetical protein
MAKFELSIYDENDKVIKTYQRNKCSVDTFLKFQKYSEKITGDKVKNDVEFFAELKGLFVEMFPAMTESEYMNNTDVAEVIALFNTVISKATQFTAGKNA